MDRRCKFELIITPAHERVNPIPNTLKELSPLAPDLKITLNGSPYLYHSTMGILP
jgi:hypothetical protein